MKGFLKNGLAAAIQIAVFSTFLGAWGVSHAQTSDTNRPLMEGIEYASVSEIREKMIRNGLTSVALVEHLLARISALDKRGPKINAIIELNPEALSIAAALDRERQQGRIRGPLHGIPVLLKDNIDTGDRMQTTAGSLAMVGQPAAQDAFIVRKLRDAGAIILGKTNLSEWANFRGNGLPDGWSGRGGQTKNPHLLDGFACGSSTGSAAGVAAGFAPLAVGTETSGSIVCPAFANGVVGFKPTVGLLGRTGIIPVTRKLDTPGPMTRTVFDAALLLNAMQGIDPADSASASVPDGERDYTATLTPGALKGRRIGYPNKFEPGSDASKKDPQFAQALETMRAAGAILIPTQIQDPNDGVRVEEAMFMGLKRELPAYLSSRTGLAIQTVQDLIDFNRKNPGPEGYGQEVIEGLSRMAFDEALYNDLWLSINSENGKVIDDVLAKHNLEALISDVASPAMNVVPLAGYPGIMVPSGIDADGLPTSVFFYGERWSDTRLLAFAYSYEQASLAWRAPTFRSQ
jgi:amidase